MQKLEDRQKVLLDRKQKIKDETLIRQSLALAKNNWDSENFDWSKKLVRGLSEIFKLKEFRPLQIRAMNVFLSKEDSILVMPTGGGKSLCFQLPAVISVGVTIVISPLLSLMEDQIHALRKLNINARFICAKTKDETKDTINMIADPNSGLKLVYVTPEFMAKSKRFMSSVQKAFERKILTGFAIDEVHCCSQWGHDFRPDYKFLGILKAQFPGVPILGLTATAPAKVIVDIQKMIDIQGSLVLRAFFNRPNLYYEVRRKPADKEACLDIIANLLKTRFVLNKIFYKQLFHSGV